MTINFEQVDNVIRNIIFTINALSMTNNQLESEASRLSKCNGTKENPHNHSAQIASIRKIIYNNKEKIEQLKSICEDLCIFKNDVLRKDIDLSVLFKEDGLLEKILQKVVPSYNCPYENEQTLNDGELADEKEFVKEMENIEFNYEYIKLELPLEVDGKIKRYEDYRKLSDVTSNQYKLQQDAYTDELGFRRIKLDYIREPAYMVALGSFYTNYDSKGVVFQVILDNGNEFYCVAGDMKSDVDTDAGNQYTFSPDMGITQQNADIIEFIMDTDNKYAKELLPKKDGGKGYGVLNLSENYKEMSGSILEIRKLVVPCALEEE